MTKQAADHEAVAEPDRHPRRTRAAASRPAPTRFAVINTLMGMAIDVETRQPIIGNIQGGLSGPAIKPIALLKVHQVYRESPRRTAFRSSARAASPRRTTRSSSCSPGATTVGVGTALFYDPLVCKKINDGIAAYLAKHGMQSVSELRSGSAHQCIACRHPDRCERLPGLPTLIVHRQLFELARKRVASPAPSSRAAS